MNWEEVARALLIGAPAAALGYLAYRRSVKVDAISEQAGIASHVMSGTGQVIAGLNDLIDQLQEDNKNFRDDIKHLALRLDEVTAERDALKVEVASLRRRYGDNGDTPQPPTKEAAPP